MTEETEQKILEIKNQTSLPMFLEIELADLGVVNRVNALIDGLNVIEPGNSLEIPNSYFKRVKALMLRGVTMPPGKKPDLSAEVKRLVISVEALLPRSLLNEDEVKILTKIAEESLNKIFERGFLMGKESRNG